MQNPNVPSSAADLTGSNGTRFFDDLKSSTNGMLRASLYRKMYKLSLEQGKQSVIDIGVGRGASSISFALGIAHSGRSELVHVIDQFTQKRRGPHLYSEEMRPNDCRQANIEVFLENVRHYGVGSLINVQAGTTDEVAPNFDPELRADILSIDADGNIDRDLEYFFDNVSLGGWIIIDDCADIVNRNGANTIARYVGKPHADVRSEIEELSETAIRQILGKHLLSYMLAACLENEGALVKKQVVGRTAFFVKTSALRFQDLNIDFSAVSSSIRDRFFEALEAANHAA